MHLFDQSHDAHHATRTRLMVLWSLATAAFAATALWGFWDRGVYALGMNAFVYLAATLALFLWVMRRDGMDLRANLHWIVPVCLIAASFLLYDNPFLKIISILVLPTSFAGFAILASHPERRQLPWSSRLLGRVAVRGAAALVHLGDAVSAHLHLRSAGRNAELAKRAIIGLLLFFVIAATVVLPLLASADPAFAVRVEWLLEWVRQLMSGPAVLRIIFAAVLSVGTVAAVMAWTKAFHHDDAAHPHLETDSVVAGIVLGGTLLVYLSFLAIQLGRLWTGELPFEFAEAVRFVKSGFWQLMGLTLLNVVLFLLAYRRTSRPVQHVLTAFAAASLLLLASAAQRVGLYVLTYGFSYEKFFAVYAVLFCAALFGWLLSRMFMHDRADVLRFGALLALWMYAVLTVFPVEQAVFRANLALRERADSRIQMLELTMLSPDVLGVAKRAWFAGELAERNGLRPDWSRWVVQQERIVQEKAWYEKNVMNLLYEARPDAYAMTPQRVAMEGTYLRCPLHSAQRAHHAEAEGVPATDPMCLAVSGLGFYVLDLTDAGVDTTSEALLDVRGHVRMRVSGMVMPAEMLSSDLWHDAFISRMVGIIYQIDGVEVL